MDMTFTQLRSNQLADEDEQRASAIAQLRQLGWTVFCDEEEEDA